VEIVAGLAKDWTQPLWKVNQDKNSMFLLFSLLFLIVIIQLLLSFQLTGLKSNHLVDCILILREFSKLFD